LAITDLPLPAAKHHTRPVTITAKSKSCRKTSILHHRQTRKTKKSRCNSPHTAKQELRRTGGATQSEPSREIKSAEIKFPLKKSARN